MGWTPDVGWAIAWTVTNALLGAILSELMLLRRELKK